MSKTRKKMSMKEMGEILEKYRGWMDRESPFCQCEECQEKFSDGA